MRLLPIVLALSLAANVALAAAFFVMRPASESPDKMPSAGITQTAVKANPQQLAQAFKTADATSVFAQLRALGMSEATARDLANRLIWDKYHTRQRELSAAKRVANSSYWSGPDKTSRNNTAEERAELRALAQQARKESIALLGTSAFLGSEQAAARYSFLSPEKAAQIVDAERDYGDMGAELSEESARFSVSSDREKRRILYEEYRKDLATMLTPQEMAEYDKRYSQSASIVRRSVAGLNLSEAEYTAIYASQKGVDDAYPFSNYSASNPPSSAQLAERREAQERASAEIKTLLGDERYADYLRAQSSDYRGLQAAADRFQLPVETINTVYSLRDTAAAESQRIAADQSLDAAGKKQALQNLADQLRAQVRTNLGDEVGNAYLEKNMTWLARVSSGSAVEFTANGTRYKPVAPPSGRPRSGGQ